MAPRSGMRVEGSFNNPIRRLEHMSKRVHDLTPIWPKVGLFLSREVSKQFTTEGAYMGTPWAPLNPEYHLWKLGQGYPDKTLVQTGELRASYTKRPMNIEQYRPDSATFGSGLDKAKWHSEGTDRIPSRPILVIRLHQRKRIKKIIGNYIKDGTTWPI